MCKSKTASETVGQELLRLIQEIPDSNKDLRERIQKAIGDLELHKSYGLRFERHLPEVIGPDGAEIGLATPYYPYLEHVASVAGENPKGPEHILLEADNYVALKYLQYTHEGKVDVIYIDPPYNTGSKDWKYNNDYVDREDIFRHSRWLSFMEKRLWLAKKLLKPQGVLICSIDENELCALGMLLQDIFGQYDITPVTVIHNPKGIQGDNFSFTHETWFFITPKGIKTIKDRKLDHEEIKPRNLRDSGGESRREDAKNCFYPIVFDKSGKLLGAEEVTKATEHPKQLEIEQEKIKVYPIDPTGIERKWRYARQSFHEIASKIHLRGFPDNPQVYLTKETGKVKTVWVGSKFSATEHGTKLVKELGLNFPYAKSVHAVKEAIDYCLPQDGICLDFFAGSGTTFQAVAELNEADGGTRQCILVTNNESNICREVTWERVKRVTTGTHAYPECTKKYDGNPSAHATFYKVAIQPEEKIERTIRGWKKTIEPYLPLISTKLNVPFNWKPIRDVKLGFVSEDVAVIPDAAYLEWKWKGLKSHKIAHICIIGDDIEDYEGVQKALKRETTATRFTFLPRQYLEYFDGFHSKGAI